MRATQCILALVIRYWSRHYILLYSIKTKFNDNIQADWIHRNNFIWLEEKASHIIIFQCLCRIHSFLFSFCFVWVLFNGLDEQSMLKFCDAMMTKSKEMVLNVSESLNWNCSFDSSNDITLHRTASMQTNSIWIELTISVVELVPSPKAHVWTCHMLNLLRFDFMTFVWLTCKI